MSAPWAAAPPSASVILLSIALVDICAEKVFEIRKTLILTHKKGMARWAEDALRRDEAATPAPRTLSSRCH